MRFSHRLLVRAASTVRGRRLLHPAPQLHLASSAGVFEPRATRAFATAAAEKHEFQAEARNLLDIVAKSLYSDSEVSYLSRVFFYYSGRKIKSFNHKSDLSLWSLWKKNLIVSRIIVVLITRFSFESWFRMRQMLWKREELQSCFREEAKVKSFLGFPRPKLFRSIFLGFLKYVKVFFKTGTSEWNFVTLRKTILLHLFVLFLNYNCHEKIFNSQTPIYEY